jgi:hypothetical protein
MISEPAIAVMTMIASNTPRAITVRDVAAVSSGSLLVATDASAKRP